MSERAKQALALALVLATVFVWWYRFVREDAPDARPPASVAKPSVAAGAERSARVSVTPEYLAMPKVLLRNPFASKYAFKGRLPSWKRLYVSMIAVGKNRRDTFARINGRILRVGDEIHGYKVLAIRDRGVWVRRAGEKKHFIRIF